MERAQADANDEEGKQSKQGEGPVHVGGKRDILMLWSVTCELSLSASGAVADRSLNNKSNGDAQPRQKCPGLVVGDLAYYVFIDAFVTSLQPNGRPS